MSLAEVGMQGGECVSRLRFQGSVQGSVGRCGCQRTSGDRQLSPCHQLRIGEELNRVFDAVDGLKIRKIKFTQPV